MPFFTMHAARRRSSSCRLRCDRGSTAERSQHASHWLADACVPANVNISGAPLEAAPFARCRTFMGVMDIDPLKLLEDGIRSQIGARIARTATATLAFSQRWVVCSP